jgi:hypothetical protein
MKYNTGYFVDTLYVQPTPPMPTFTAGWTIRTTGNNRTVATLDPAGGTSKTIYETVTQLNDDLTPMEGGFVSSFRGSNVWGNDQYAAFAPSAGIYNSVWTNASEYSANTESIFCNFGESNTNNITDLYTMDFFNQQKQVENLGFFARTSSLPQRAEDILNATRITALNSSLQYFRYVKTPVIPFITACLAAMPNLVSITSPLRNSCSASPDYQEALTLYPNWF